MAVTLDINSMRYPITVLEEVTIRDIYGAESIEYQTLYNLKAGVRYVNGSKSVNNEEVFSSQILVFTIHYRDINEKNRIEFKGNKYTISFISPIGYNQGLELTCEKINE